MFFLWWSFPKYFPANFPHLDDAIWLVMDSSEVSQISSRFASSFLSLNLVVCVNGYRGFCRLSIIFYVVLRCVTLCLSQSIKTVWMKFEMRSFREKFSQNVWHRNKIRCSTCSMYFLSCEGILRNNWRWAVLHCPVATVIFWGRNRVFLDEI